MGSFFHNLVVFLTTISVIVPSSFIVAVSFMTAFLIAKGLAKSLLSWGQ